MPTNYYEKFLARIDRDYIAAGRVGYTWGPESIPMFFWPYPVEPFELEKAPTRFRLKDDDNEVYYGGWLYNDSECIMQQIVLAWAMRDAGCTVIEVKLGTEWVQEIS